MDETVPKKTSLKSRLVTALRPKQKGGAKLQKEPPPDFRPRAVRLESADTVQTSSNDKATASFDTQIEAPVKTGPVNFYNKNTNGITAQTGELWDEAEMLHSLLRRDSHDSMNSINRRARERWLVPDPSQKPGESVIASLPPALWEEIAGHLTVTEAANLAVSTKTLLSLLGKGPLLALDLPENHQNKVDFLLPMDRHLPNHLFCFPCATYHVRLQKGKEKLRANRILNFIYNCPNPKLQSRHRLTPGHSLPFAFVQLAFRYEQLGHEFGIPLESLSRRYKDPESEWLHQTRYFFHKGHLLLRVTSKAFAQAGLPVSGLRHFLYSREDYTPYFSVCDHWRDGELMNLCKCAMSHIPKPRETVMQQLQKGPALQLALLNPKIFITLCQECRPMRRCPECPTEYLIELKLEEDRTDPNPSQRFKQCLVVTRWSDLGDGTTPMGNEWAAICGKGNYESFKLMGRRAIAGTFESQSGVTIPGQRILSLNPKGERLGEAGHGWY